MPRDMKFRKSFELDCEVRREELIRTIEHAVERMSLSELEALYYDMATKNYISEVL